MHLLKKCFKIRIITHQATLAQSPTKAIFHFGGTFQIFFGKKILNLQRNGSNAIRLMLRTGNIKSQIKKKKNAGVQPPASVSPPRSMFLIMEISRQPSPNQVFP